MFTVLQGSLSINTVSGAKGDLFLKSRLRYLAVSTLLWCGSPTESSSLVLSTSGSAS